MKAFNLNINDKLSKSSLMITPETLSTNLAQILQIQASKIDLEASISQK